MRRPMVCEKRKAASGVTPNAVHPLPTPGNEIIADTGVRGMATASAGLDRVGAAVRDGLRLGMGLGYADNRDFWRAMAPSGIGAYRAGLSDVPVVLSGDTQPFYQLGPLPPNRSRSCPRSRIWWCGPPVILEKAVVPAATARACSTCSPSA